MNEIKIEDLQKVLDKITGLDEQESIDRIEDLGILLESVDRTMTKGVNYVVEMALLLKRASLNKSWTKLHDLV